MTAKDGWDFVRLLNYRSNIRRVMLRHRAIYAPPARRWTFDGYGVDRRHEHFFNVRQPR